MFEVTKTYTCNGCSAIATEAKAKKWVHMDNSPNDGKQSMDFCPKCFELLNSMFNTINNSIVSTEPAKTESAIEQTSTEPEPEPVVDVSTVTEDTPYTEPEYVLSVSEQQLSFYKQLYSRVLFAITCDDSFDVIRCYLRYIPGAFSVDNAAKNTNAKFTLNCNGKRLVISKDVENSITTEIKIMQGNRPLLTRKVSKYTAVQALIEDTYTSTASLLPCEQMYYTDNYIRECLIEIDDGITDGLPLRDLREWLGYAVMQAGLELT